jgi:endo-alpha-1,4-polygalactosaminidase (GH114 family)
VAVVIFSGCVDGNKDSDLLVIKDYRQDMRDLVRGISNYAREISPNFTVISQDGHEL